MKTAWTIAFLTVVQLAVGAFSGLQQYDLMHFVGWGLLCGGLGLLLVPHLRPAWLQVLLVTGLGALLAGVALARWGRRTP